MNLFYFLPVVKIPQDDEAVHGQLGRGQHGRQHL